MLRANRLFSPHATTNGPASTFLNASFYHQTVVDTFTHRPSLLENFGAQTLSLFLFRLRHHMFTSP